MLSPFKSSPTGTPHSFARTFIGLLTTGALAFGLTACSSSGEDDGSLGTITFGYQESWPDGVAMAYLLKPELEEMGYTVEHETIPDTPALFVAVAEGDVTMYPSAWIESGAKEYYEKYQDKLESVGGYFKNARITLNVPEYVEDINSVEDLKGQGDRFDGRIVGIEPGTGMAQTIDSEMIPEYGLEGEYEQITSSTAAMLSELDKAVDKEEPIVVSLWRPYWANVVYPVKALEDPTNIFAPETLHMVANSEWAQDNPELVDWLGEIKMTTEEQGELENLIVNEYKDDPAKAVEEWTADHPDFFPEHPDLGA